MVKVLVVDDSKFMAKALGTVLSELGFVVVGLAHDGIEGVTQFERLHPDVTLLDITMPNMDGVECLTRIRRIDADAHVVMLSAIQDTATIANCLSLGAASFLQKPIRKDNPEDLNRLRETLNAAAGVVTA